jgi:DNA polymerase III subunit epsilon
MMKAIAVIDVETTGLNPYRYDRVVEIAALLVVPGKGVLREITSLVNPERDIGPTSIHGITASDVVDAPRFPDIAGHLTDFLFDSILLAGHNVRFDIAFLQAEYERIGIEMPRYPMLDTLALAGGGTLSACCEDYGVDFDGRAHSALHDARATACLLQKILLENPDFLIRYDSCQSLAWPSIELSRGTLCPRGTQDRVTSGVPNYIQQLAQSLSRGSGGASTHEGERDYRELLWRALEDGRVENSEGDSLVDVAIHWGLCFERIKVIHLDYLSQLALAAMADGHVTDVEQREIQLAAQLLGFGHLSDNQLNNLFQSRKSENHSDVADVSDEGLIGKSVCFTGECSCMRHGQLITREMAEKFAADKGLQIMQSVTKKLNILVVADPNTQSGKAKKARQYGIRIIHEPIFWRSLGIVVE